MNITKLDKGMNKYLLVPLIAIALPAFSEQAKYHHVHLRATDTQEAAGWYAQHFDGTAARLGIYDISRFNNVILIFFPEAQPGVDGSPFPGELKGTVGSALDHIGFNAPDTKKRMDELEAKGVEIAVPTGSLGGKFNYGFVRDPWGTLIEITDIVKNSDFSHVHVVSEDAEATAKWYADVFGGTITHPANIPFIFSVEYGTVSLVSTTPQATRRQEGPLARTMHRSVDHLGWSFTNLESEIERMKNSGVKVVRDMFDFRGTNIAFIESPDGVLIELVELPAAP